MREWSSKDISVEILSHKVDDKPKALGTYFWNLRFEVIKWKKQKQKKKIVREKREESKESELRGELLGWGCLKVCYKESNFEKGLWI